MFYSGNFLHRFLPRFCLFYSYWKWAKDEEQLQQKLLKAKEMRWSFDDTICCTELVKSFLLHTTRPSRPVRTLNIPTTLNRVAVRKKIASATSYRFYSNSIHPFNCLSIIINFLVWFLKLPSLFTHKRFNFFPVHLNLSPSTKTNGSHVCRFALFGNISMMIIKLAPSHSLI